MKSSNFRATIFSSVAGIVLGLAMFLSFGYAQPAVADDWCFSPPEGCVTLSCYTNGAGAKSCKYVAVVNGASCHVGGSCTAVPNTDRGGEIGINEGVSE